ncbi:hypothetical protein P8452_49323 [Trifolium repens]|nr:hypothetical protein P8452_49323 [Trifolium repens]
MKFIDGYDLDLIFNSTSSQVLNFLKDLLEVFLKNCIKNEECIKKQKQQENQCCDQKKRRINAKPHASYHSSSNYSYELSMVL